MTAQPLLAPTLTEDFKEAFGSHPAGVAVITAASASGPVGLTASSVASVSAEPPLLAFSLASRAGSAAAIAEADTFVVHLLGSSDVALARLFATAGSERFTSGLQWRTLPTGEPLLAHGGHTLRCEILSRTPAGGSVLIAARVVEVLPRGGAEDVGAGPLVYHRRRFHTLGEATALP
ncbi:flavin reductase family protein [Arthrobacter sp. 35W]|uniref:flavin reductase family protein n=1 Tax=Arthrobacter sp. 35W TaxID=1132441 RepID=UPI0004239476|nr:flavin reductase family protein [Arthrobacter sp. 35W]